MTVSRNHEVHVHNSGGFLKYVAFRADGFSRDNGYFDVLLGFCCRNALRVEVDDTCISNEILAPGYHAPSKNLEGLLNERRTLGRAWKIYYFSVSLGS